MDQHANRKGYSDIDAQGEHRRRCFWSNDELYKDGAFYLAGAAPMAFLILGDFQLPGIPATMALAAVALIGYLFGRQSRPGTPPAETSSESLQRALSDARQLEQITNEMLNATRDALDQCRQLNMPAPARQACPPDRPISAARHSACPPVLQ